MMTNDRSPMTENRMKRLLMSVIVPLLTIAAGAGYASDQTAEEILKAIVKVRAFRMMPSPHNPSEPNARAMAFSLIPPDTSLRSDI